MPRSGFCLFCFLLLPVLYYCSLPISLEDLGIWVAHGDYFLRTGEILRHDVFSVLPTRELVYPWGVTVVYGLLDRLGGIGLVSVFHKLMMLVFVALAYRYSLCTIRSPGRDVWTSRNAAFVLVFWLGSAIICVDRPAMLAIVPFLMAFQVLNQKKALDRGSIAKLLAIELVWVNLHGSWILLPAMLAWRIFFRSLHAKAMPWLECLGLGLLLLVTGINPFGFRVWSRVFETVAISKGRGLEEWMRTGLLTPERYFPQGIWFYSLLACFVAWLGFRLRKEARPWLLLSSPFVLLFFIGPNAVRNTIWPFLALLPFAASQGLLSTAEVEAEQGMRASDGMGWWFFNAVLAGGLLGLTVLCTPYLKTHASSILPAKKRPLFDETAPYALAQAIRETRSDAPIFNQWEYGSFLALALPNKIFIDTRNIIYSPEAFNAYVTVASGSPGWERIMDRYGIRFALLAKKPKAAGLAGKLSASKDWKLLAEDHDSVLFAR